MCIRDRFQGVAANHAPYYANRNGQFWLYYDENCRHPTPSPPMATWIIDNKVPNPALSQNLNDDTVGCDIVTRMVGEQVFTGDLPVGQEYSRWEFPHATCGGAFNDITMNIALRLSVASPSLPPSLPPSPSPPP
eukprot:5639032-Prymnesium_polylepis.1